jgi:3-phosphoshikimate 1-carboxyvinyltransferase
MTVFRVKPASGPLRGSVEVPGDKSIGHRAVMLAALGDGRAAITGLSGGEDNRRTVDAFRAMGVEIRETSTTSLEVVGVGIDGLRKPKGPIDCGNSGTSMRLLAGILAGQPFETTLDGDEYLRLRPMARVVRPLGAMGAEITGATGKKAGEIYPPLVIRGKRPLRSTQHATPVASAQVKSALLLAALWADGAVSVREPGPSRDHTERMLGALGVPLSARVGGEIAIDVVGMPRQLPAHDWIVPGDISSAAFLLVAGSIVSGSEITIRGVGVNPTRTGVLDALWAMGANIELAHDRNQGGEPLADLTVRAAELHATELRGDLVVRAIDEIPILAVAATQAHGTTVIRDAAELRVKESDRIAMVARELSRLGARVRELDDGLEIEGPTQLAGGVTCESGGDHRIAMACSVAATVCQRDVTIDDVANVATSFPGFENSLAALGADILKV